MSRVPYTIDVDRFICTELQDIRDMLKFLDFSRLGATVERIQYHAQAMEDALYDRRDNMSRLQNGIDDLVEKIKKENVGKIQKPIIVELEKIVKKSREKK